MLRHFNLLVSFQSLTLARVSLSLSLTSALKMAGRMWANQESSCLVLFPTLSRACPRGALTLSRSIYFRPLISPGG